MQKPVSETGYQISVQWMQTGEVKNEQTNKQSKSTKLKTTEYN